MSTPEKPVNLNTVLLTIVLALAGWTLNKVNGLGEQVVLATERNVVQASAILDIRSRMTTAEATIQANQLAIARMQGRP